MKKLTVLLLVVSISVTLYAQHQIPVAGVRKGLSDEQLMDLVQKQTFRFFWHGAHPVSGLARERSDTVRATYYWDYINEAWDEPNQSTGIFGPDDCAIGGTGFGIMATVIAVERGWIGRDTAIGRLNRIVDFLARADAWHGIYPHFMNGKTGKPVPFDRLDDASDLVETSYLFMGLLTAKSYFKANNPKEGHFRRRVEQLWNAANWNWHSKGGGNRLYWHWSPNNGFDMNFPIWGWNECLITYILAAGSPYHAIDKSVYDSSWTGSTGFKNGKSYYGYPLPLGNYDKGGPLFFVQYTFMGIDPNGLTDSLGNDYFLQGKNHTLINRQYCIENPQGFKGYGPNCWGLTAGDSYKGYVAHCPEVDRGVIQPTAALSSMMFTPKESIGAMRYFYDTLGTKIWSKYGFVDGFSVHHNWYAKSHLAIDQGPIIVNIENYRTGLIWKLFMQLPEVQLGLKRLGFRSTKWMP